MGELSKKLMTIVGVALLAALGHVTARASDGVPSTAHPIAIHDLDSRLQYAESLLERYPNILRANLQYRRNLLEVLGDTEKVNALLGEHANPLTYHPLSSMMLTYSPNAAIVYDEAKIAEVRTQLDEAIQKLPLKKFTNLKDDLALLKTLSVAEDGTHSAKLFQANLGRLIRVAPIAYDAGGEHALDTPGELASKIERIKGNEIDNLYTDLFTQHQTPLIETLAKEKGNGLYTEALKSNQNNFVQKIVASAIVPITQTGGKAESRYLKIEEVLTPDNLFRGCFGKDCSILSVPNYVQVKGSKTYFIRKSKNSAHLPDGYAFAVPVEVEGKKNPYIITVNGNMTSGDVQKVIQAIGKDWGTQKYVYADLVKTRFLVNTEPMRDGLKAAGGERVFVKMPEGWDKVEKYINERKVAGYSNYYKTENLTGAYLAKIPPEGNDLLYPIQKAVNIPEFKKAKNLMTRPVLDRAVLASEALTDAGDSEFKKTVLERLHVNEEQTIIARRLKDSVKDGIDHKLYRDLTEHLDFKFKNLGELDLLTQAKSLNRLYSESPDIAKAEEWKKSFAANWADIEHNWHQAEFEQRNQVSGWLFDEVIGGYPKEQFKPTQQFLDDAFDWMTRGGENNGRQFNRFYNMGLFTDEQVIEGLPKMQAHPSGFVAPEYGSKMWNVVLEHAETTKDSELRKRLMKVLFAREGNLTKPEFAAKVESLVRAELTEHKGSPTLETLMETSTQERPMQLLATMDKEFPDLYLWRTVLNQNKINSAAWEKIYLHLDRFPESSKELLRTKMLSFDANLHLSAGKAWMKAEVDKELLADGKSSTLTAILSAGHTDGECMKIFREMEEKYPKLNLHLTLLDVDNLGRDAAAFVAEYISKHPKEITKTRLLNVARGLATKEFYDKDLLAPMHPLGETLMKEGSIELQDAYLSAMMNGYNGAGKSAWGSMIPQKYLKKVGEWIEAKGPLTLDQFYHYRDILSTLNVPQYTNAYTYRYPRNLGQFMLHEDADVRASALKLKRQLARQGLPSAMDRHFLQTEKVVEYLHDKNYQGLKDWYVYTKKYDRWTHCTTQYSLEEVLEHATVQDPAFYAQYAKWYLSEKPDEADIAGTLDHYITHSEMSPLAESFMIKEAAGKTSERAQKGYLKMLGDYVSVKGRLKKQPTEAFYRWTEQIAASPGKSLAKEEANKLLRKVPKYLYVKERLMLPAPPRVEEPKLLEAPKPVEAPTKNLATKKLTRLQCFLGNFKSLFIKTR